MPLPKPDAPPVTRATLLFKTHILPLPKLKIYFANSFIPASIPEIFNSNIK